MRARPAPIAPTAATGQTPGADGSCGGSTRRRRRCRTFGARRRNAPGTPHVLHHGSAWVAAHGSAHGRSGYLMVFLQPTSMVTVALLHVPRQMVLSTILPPPTVGLLKV